MKLQTEYICLVIFFLTVSTSSVVAFTPLRPTTSSKPFNQGSQKPVASARTIDPRKRTFLSVSTSSTDSLSTSADATSNNEAPKLEEGSSIRPLHQNWWPVTLLSALDESRPNAVELLGMRLVLFYDSESESWKCLDDKCPHRFAPLSEGRIVHTAKESEGSSKCDTGGKTCIQCAYHGWEFNVDGSSAKIPQREKHQNQNDKRIPPPVQSFQVQTEAGIVWVWADPATNALSQLIPLPVSPLLKSFHEEFGDGCAFMRDLPYGMELLGENLADLSHLPFSHHSVGGLARDQGCPLPLRMLSESEKEEKAEWEKDDSKSWTVTGASPVLPKFQVEVMDAARYDPIFRSLPPNVEVNENSTCTISFYEPSHIRYRRNRNGDSSAGHVELFMVPTKPGRSRVILVNTFDFLLPLRNTPPKGKATLKSRIASFSPGALKSKIKMAILLKLFDPNTSKSHMLSHRIFDGDGIFLNKQGDRMRRNNLSYKDYFTPTKADILVLAFRRYLNKAARITEQAGHSSASASVSDDNSYVDDNLRSKILDRYESHTANCPICLKDLEKSRRWLKRWDLMQVALVGAAGSSTTILTASAVVSLLGFSVPGLIMSTSGITSISTILGAKVAGKKKIKLDSKIQQFLFEDYVHAEKN